MKAAFIVINWALSFMGLTIDTDTAPAWAILIAIAWPAFSTLLLRYANRRGWMDKFVKRFKIDEL